MSTTQLEIFLARLYVDANARANFKCNPRAEAKKAGLSDEQCSALENLDWIGLEMAARSLRKKRQPKRKRGRFSGFKASLRAKLSRLSRLFSVR